MNNTLTAPTRAIDHAVPTAATVLHVRIAVKELGIATAHLVGIAAGAEPTAIAGAPDLVGVLNFADRPVPVLDLRTRYGLPAASPGPTSRTLVLQIDAAWIGLVVDEVLGVIDLRGEALRPGPVCDAVDDPSCINGLCRHVRDGVAHELILVDIAHLIGRDALARIAAFAATRTGALPA